MERAVPILPGDDLGVAKDFYTKLGFDVVFEATDDGKSGIMGLERGTITLTVDCPMPGHGRLCHRSCEERLARRLSCWKTL